LKILFFTPHADDIELGVPFIYLKSLRLANEVVEVIMTNNEYGTTDDEFKGERLTKIRELEVKKANSLFENATKNEIRVIRMGYIDGHLPLNKSSVHNVANLLLREKPNIIFTPDPWYAQDFHADHLNTGLLIYFSLKKIGKSFKPQRLFYYYSTKNNYYLTSNWKDFNIVEKAIASHKSQYSPLESKLIVWFYNKFNIFRHYLKRGKFSESFREQKFENNIPEYPPKFTEMPFKDRMFYYILSKLTIWGAVKFYTISPEALGLNINYDDKDILKLKDKKYQYKYKTKRK